MLVSGVDDGDECGVVSWLGVCLCLLEFLWLLQCINGRGSGGGDSVCWDFHLPCLFLF